MSVTSHIAVEVKNSWSQDWWAVSSMYIVPSTHEDSLLAFPWGEWKPNDDDNPKPIVAPRGVVKDPSMRVAASLRDIGKPRCATWLTTEEIALAAEKHFEVTGRRSAGFDAITALMRSYQVAKNVTEVRLVVWYS